MTSAQALYSRLWVQAPSLGALGLGAFVAVALGGQARAGLAHVKNKRNQRWIEPSGGTDGTVLQRFLERSLRCPSRTLIMVTLTWTPVNSSNLWSRMKPPSTSPPMQTRRTTSCLGEWH